VRQGFTCAPPGLVDCGSFGRTWRGRRREDAMTNTSPVDRVEVHVLVDNVTDSLSTVPSHVENEWSYLWRNGMRRLSGRCICCAAHGLSCLITAFRGESTHTILFDTGPEEDTFERNVSRLGVDLGTVEVIVLSHATLGFERRRRCFWRTETPLLDHRSRSA
jgi:hypothetical protein